MKWLKKNLALVIGGVTALGLLGFAIFFLLTKRQAVEEVTAQLNEQTDELKKLTTRDPYPNQENIDAARREQKKLAEFIQSGRKFFDPVAAFTNVESSNFKDLLQTTISDLERDAEKAGVHLPNQYNFTFTPQRKSVVFAPETLVPLAMQVAEIKAICGILFDARIHALTGLRRAPIAKEDQQDADYLTGKKPTTNALTGAVLVPYEVQFQGFTAELADVLEGFYRSTNCFIVRNIDVQTNVSNFAATTAAAAPAVVFAPPAAGPGPSTPSSQMYEMQMQRRYGIGGRYGRPGPPPPVNPAQPAPVTTVTAPALRKGPETILDERPFRVTMYLEVVRLTQRAASKSAK